MSPGRHTPNRSGPAGPARGQAELVRDLASARDELQVADREARHQHEHIADLIRRQESEHFRHERLLGVLPVAVLVTSWSGVVRRCNAATGVLVGRHPVRVEGTSVFDLFSAEDQPALRELLERAKANPVGARETGLAVSETGHVPVEASVIAVDPERETISWLLLTADTVQPNGGGVPLAEGLARIAALSSDGASREELLRTAVVMCRDVLGPRAEVTFQLGPPEAVELLASSGQLAQLLDGAQVGTGEGPTATAFREGVQVTSYDVHADRRWSRWAAAIPRSDVAVIAVPVRLDDEVAGVLTVYQIDAPTAAEHFGTVETLALTFRAVLQELALREEVRRAADDLGQALASRAAIDVAKGIVMAKKGCSADEAFEHLVDLASTQHVKLRVVAATIVDAVAAGGAERWRGP